VYRWVIPERHSELGYLSPVDFEKNVNYIIYFCVYFYGDNPDGKTSYFERDNELKQL
jgi:hypothetical protein